MEIPVHHKEFSDWQSIQDYHHCYAESLIRDCHAGSLAATRCIMAFALGVKVMSLSSFDDYEKARMIAIVADYIQAYRESLEGEK